MRHALTCARSRGLTCTRALLHVFAVTSGSSCRRLSASAAFEACDLAPFAQYSAQGVVEVTYPSRLCGCCKRETEESNGSFDNVISMYPSGTSGARVKTGISPGFDGQLYRRYLVSDVEKLGEIRYI